MAEQVDYFSNHKLKLRFPWRLYHGPIVRELGRAVARHPGGDVLNVGSGPFLEREQLRDTHAKYTLCDIDARAIAMARDLHGERIARADTVEPGAALPYETGSFDLVVTMDVVEHLPDPGPWCAELFRVLRHGGGLYLTTPNYGLSTLGVIERTALEAIARYQGFSRRALHPSKFSKRSLRAELERAGFADVEVKNIAFGWVLAATARRPG